MNAMLYAIATFLAVICGIMLLATWDVIVVKKHTFWEYIVICSWEIGFFIAGIFFGLSLS